MEKYNCCKGHVENALLWVIKKSEDYFGLKKKQKKDEDENNKFDNDSKTGNQDDINTI